MDNTQPMTQERFLGLLNNGSRTPEEEAELQAELTRQANVQQENLAKEEATETPEQEAVEDAQPEVVEQPQAEVTEVTEVAPESQPTQAEQPVVADTAESSPYTITNLKKEVADAVSFLDGCDQSIAVEMAKSAFVNAQYWLNLAEQGK